MTSQENLWNTLKSGITTATKQLWDIFVSKDPEAWTKISNQITIPVAQKANTTVANIGTGILNITGLTWPIIFVLIGGIVLLITLRHFKI